MVIPMYCSHCGTDNPENAKYCIRCGSAMPNANRHPQAGFDEQSSHRDRRLETIDYYRQTALGKEDDYDSQVVEVLSDYVMSGVHSDYAKKQEASAYTLRATGYDPARSAPAAKKWGASPDPRRRTAAPSSSRLSGVRQAAPDRRRPVYSQTGMQSSAQTNLQPQAAAPGSPVHVSYPSNTSTFNNSKLPKRQRPDMSSAAEASYGSTGAHSSSYNPRHSKAAAKGSASVYPDGKPPKRHNGVKIAAVTFCVLALCASAALIYFFKINPPETNPEKTAIEITSESSFEPSVPSSETYSDAAMSERMTDSAAVSEADGSLMTSQTDSMNPSSQTNATDPNASSAQASVQNDVAVSSQSPSGAVEASPDAGNYIPAEEMYVRSAPDLFDQTIVGSTPPGTPVHVVELYVNPDYPDLVWGRLDDGNYVCLQAYGNIFFNKAS